MQRSGFLSSLLWVMDILGSYGDTSFSWLGFSFLPGSQFIPLVFQPAPSSHPTQAGFLCVMSWLVLTFSFLHVYIFLCLIPTLPLHGRHLLKPNCLSVPQRNHKENPSNLRNLDMILITVEWISNMRILRNGSNH